MRALVIAELESTDMRETQRNSEQGDAVEKYIFEEGGVQKYIFEQAGIEKYMIEKGGVEKYIFEQAGVKKCIFEQGKEVQILTG